jgi:glyoxalase family protein
MDVQGIHHITAIASNPQANLDFYAGFLGLRLVKQTVNFDAPDVYHLYYGDAAGRPGTILTFFPFPDAARGKRGAGEILAVAFSIPSDSLGFWTERLSRGGIEFTGPTGRFGEELIGFLDPDGMQVELFADPSMDPLPGWAGSAVGPRHAIRTFHGVTFIHRETAQTAAFLSDVMGFTREGSEGNRLRFLVGPENARARIDVIADPSASPARQSAGSVHHIAWRAIDDEAQRAWREELSRAGASPTPVIDRSYFRSVYFREPGGVLFEIATDPPGFMIDEPVEALGTSLKLPSWLESERQLIERRLPPITVPGLLKAHV